jgi:NAD-dependent SIR2 family protein deacetylase
MSPAVTTDPAGLEALERVVAGGQVAVLSGAGLSTESGIPDYRGPTGTAARRPAPMTYAEFIGSSVARQRYWARSQLGWTAISTARPNHGHQAVARLQRAGLIDTIVTQNVDGLHTTAGATGVVDLHGRLDRVRCLGCGARTSRADLAGRLEAANTGWRGVARELRPDGDSDVPDEALASFVTVGCAGCGGTLKPDVVFFGENVPGAVVAASNRAIDSAATLLVLGSSLAVFSGRRLVLRAAGQGARVAIVNAGPTRCDGLAAARLDAPLGVTLAALADRVIGPAGR